MCEELTRTSEQGNGEKRKYHYINDDIKIDFELSVTMRDLIEKAEEADLQDRYGVYMNYAMAIDSQGKLEATRHRISDRQWDLLVMRYPV